VRRNRDENRIQKPIKAAIGRFQVDRDSIFLHSTYPSIDATSFFVAVLSGFVRPCANKTSPAAYALPSNEADRRQMTSM
jgi:hypothetical protein